SLIENGYYNVSCPAGGATQVDGLQVKESQIFKAWDTGIYLSGGCANVRLIGDVIQSNGQDGTGSGVYFHGDDLSLEGGIIEESGGRGVYLDDAHFVVISGMKVAANGLQSSTTGAASPGLQIDASQSVTVSGNNFMGSGGDVSNGAHVLLSGTSDNLTFSGNTYAPTIDRNGNAIPAYVYDVAANATLTNTHFYETAEQPAVSVFSPAAQPILASLVVPQFTQNQLGGLVMSNDSSSSTNVIDIAPGRRPTARTRRSSSCPPDAR
ncbi:MAG: right-handed parallel beta-helix repeat-containing protein, partial [Gemmataceae bacterium]